MLMTVITQNDVIFKVEVDCFIATFNEMTTKTTLGPCNCTDCTAAQTLDFVDLYSLLSEA